MEKRSSLLIMLAAALWGGIGVFFKQLSALGFTSMQVVAIRVLTAAITLGIVVLLVDRRLFKIRLKDIWCFIGTGMISLAFFNWCYFTAIDKMSLAVAAILLYTSPIFVMLFSLVLFGEKLSQRKIIALILTFLGCIFVTDWLNGGGNITLSGVVIGIGAGVGYALYSIFGRFALNKGYDSMTISLYTFIFAALGTVPLSGLLQMGPMLWQPETLLPAAGIGILCCVFPFLLYTKGLAGVENGKAAILATVEPAVACLISFGWLNEAVTLGKLSGIMLIFCSVLLLNCQSKAQPQLSKNM